MQNENVYIPQIAKALGIMLATLWIWFFWIYPIPHTTSLVGAIIPLNLYQKIIAVGAILLGLCTPLITRFFPHNAYIRQVCQIIGAIAVLILPGLWTPNIATATMQLPSHGLFVLYIIILLPYAVMLTYALQEPLVNEASTLSLTHTLSQDQALRLITYYLILSCNLTLAIIG